MYNYNVFSTKEHNYLYDGITGNILSIEKGIFENHSQLFNSEKPFDYLQSRWPNECKQIKEATQLGIISKSSDEEMQYWFDIKDYFSSIREEISHLMIGVTENCNMRCKYCVYGGHYPNERIHSQSKMNEEQIIKVINRFFEISKCEHKIINFYGGEPFICFSEISVATKYINSINNNIKIYITTNGTLIDESICKWFSENDNVHIYVSIAGIPKMHDELRIFANGKPTYEVIHNNLLKLKSFDCESYCSRVHFVFNLFDEIQLFELQNFWDTDEIFRNVITTPEITFIDCIDDDGQVGKLQEKVIGKYKNSTQKPIDAYIALLKNKELNNLIVLHFDKKMLRIHRRSNDKRQIISGVCRPFIKKLFVDVDGKLHLCENFTYGNELKTIFDPLPVEKIKNLLSKYKTYRNNDCKYCWASKLCSLCYRDVFNNRAEIDETHSKKLCHDERMLLIETMREYCEIMEIDNSLLNHLDDYEVFI